MVFIIFLSSLAYKGFDSLSSNKFSIQSLASFKSSKADVAISLGGSISLSLKNYHTFFANWQPFILGILMSM